MSVVFFCRTGSLFNSYWLVLVWQIFASIFIQTAYLTAFINFDANICLRGFAIFSTSVIIMPSHLSSWF